MGRTSDHIHFPRHVERIPRRPNGPSGYSDSLGRAVLIDIINYFADVVDAIDDIKLPKQHKDRTKLKNDKKKLCDTVVRGANTFSALFNSAKGQAKYTDLAPKNLPVYRDEINSQLLYPLSKAKSSLGRSFSFAPFQQRLMVILQHIEAEICWWLKIPRPGICYDKGLNNTTKASTTHSYGKGPTQTHGKGSTTHTHTTSKSHGQRSTQSGKTHDQRSSRPTQAKSGQERQRRSSSPADKSGGCTVM
ncbi:unnamed protein product [Fusarium langsethiae]|nr:unnamed protein product [Fusarium langsethiae]